MSKSAGAKSLQEFRFKAERRLAHQDQPVRPILEVCSKKLLHELWGRQIELELQNEELRQVQTEPEVSKILYRELYDLAPNGYFNLNRTC